MERSGVTLGNDIERLLPMELGLYMHPITKNDFLRRFVEGQTMMYEQKGTGGTREGSNHTLSWISRVVCGTWIHNPKDLP